MGHLGLGKSEYTDNEVCLPQEAKTALQLSCSLSVMNENHCRWTAFPCMQAVRRLILSAVSRGEEWRMLDAVGRQRAGTPVVSILSMQCWAVLHECGRFWMVRAEQLLTRWVAAVSLLGCAFTARHQQPKGGRKNRRRTQKAGIGGERTRKESLCAPLLYSASDDSSPPTPIPPPKPNFLLITFLQPRTRALQKRYRADPPGRLQGGPRLINWQPFDIVQSMRPPALQARVTIVCFGPTALSSTLHTRHWAI